MGPGSWPTFRRPPACGRHKHCTISAAVCNMAFFTNRPPRR
nr:MAG TPA: hypothetical protein [Caudoviricetes sp.]